MTRTRVAGGKKAIARAAYGDKSGGQAKATRAMATAMTMVMAMATATVRVMAMARM